MLPAESWDVNRARQRRATISEPRGHADGRREKAYESFAGFLEGFVRDLNQMSEDGWCLLVEGPRDERAVRRLLYRGPVVTVSKQGRAGGAALAGAKKVVVLTDLDREGAVLAARFVKALGHEGVRTSLGERRRLKAASKGVFLHIENLSRFARPE